MEAINSQKSVHSVHQLIEARVLNTPDAVAVIFNNQQLTYAELNQRSNQLAHYLRKNGVQPNTLVGVCLEPSIATIITLLAILKAGGAFVPIDPTYPSERIALILKDSKIPALITEQQYVVDLPIHNAASIYLNSRWPKISQESGENLDLPLSLENLAYVIYTSGTTGKPKGVMIEHQSLINFVQAAGNNYNLSSRDRVLQFASISFDISIEEIFVTLSHGASLIIRSQELFHSISAFLQACQDWEITVIDLPTALWHRLCAELQDLKFPEFIRLVIIGGERAVRQYLHLWRQHAPNHVRLVNTYGPTEATVITTLCDLAGPNPVDIAEGQILPIGKPIDNVQVYVLDSEQKQIPAGLTGELYVAGAGLARGYLNRSDLTAQKYIFKTFHGGNSVRLYGTGDRVRYRQDGHLEFLGRIDRQVKIRGFRVELSAIETEIEQHQSVQQVHALIREDTTRGKYLVAYIIPDEETRAADSLCQLSTKLIPRFRSYLERRLPDYMIPAHFVLLDRFPLSPNGKVDWRALPNPITERPVLEGCNTPRTSIERGLSNLWSAVLGIANVGVNDTFFELGGDSLKTMELLSQIERIHKVRLHLKDFFKMPTVAGIANLIQQANAKPKMPEEYMNLDQLKAEVTIYSVIEEQTINLKALTFQNDIFLTGATGFLGVFLLYELLQKTQSRVYCLVRAKDYLEAQEKIESSLEQAFLGTKKFYDRIIPVVGTLCQPNFGLDEEEFKKLSYSIGSIYHCAANVNLYYPYTVLRSTNVQGTCEIIKLASMGKPKLLHHISTLDVFESLVNRGDLTFYETDDIAQGSGIYSSYAQSKWIAEKLVMQAAERGLPTCIYRPGMITGHSQTGYSRTDDVFCRFVKSLVQLKKTPSIELSIDMTPVDYVSQAIVNLSLQPKSLGRTFHLVNPCPIELDSIIDELNTNGYSIERVHYSQWLAALQMKPNALSPLAALTAKKIVEEERTCLELWLGGDYDFDCSNTIQGLEGQSITCPIADRKLFKTYLNYFIQRRFVAAEVA